MGLNKEAGRLVASRERDEVSFSKGKTRNDP